MKSLFFCIAACVCTQAFSQTDSTSQTGDAASITPADTAVAPPPAVVDAAPAPSKKSKPYYPKTVVKWNVSALLFKNYQFELERSLTRKIAASVAYRTMPMTTLSDVPMLKKVYKWAGEDQSTLDEDWSHISGSNKTFTLGFRFYAGRKPGPRGFYLGLYGRYAQFKVNDNYVYETNAKNYLIPIATTAKGFGGGLYSGVQWLIGKRVALDWQIFGGHWGKLTGSGSSITNLSELSEQDKQNVKEDLESRLPDVGSKKTIDASVSNTGVNLKIDSPFIGLRSGISIGISF